MEFVISVPPGDPSAELRNTLVLEASDDHEFHGIVNLASVSVNVNQGGTLLVESSALCSALAGNYSTVRNLLQNAWQSRKKQVSDSPLRGECNFGT